MVQGILGVGGENRGELLIVTSSNNDELIDVVIENSCSEFING